MNTIFQFCLALFSIGLFFICSQLSIHAGSEGIFSERTSSQDSLRKSNTLRQMANHLDFARVRDTVWVVGDRFINVDLSKQLATLHYRNGDTVQIPISSGRITKDGGIITPSGIFSIQAKTPEAISRQFDNTKMLWWIGFNYNVGFHGLEVNSYYRHLGVRPSSHGCVRTGRENVARLYKLVEEGDPVAVFDSTPARILKFADTRQFDTTKALALGSRTKPLGKLMEERLQLLYNGERIARQNFSLYIPLKKQLRPGGYAVGNADSLIMPQQRPVTLAGRGLAFLPDHFAFPLPSNVKNSADIDPKLIIERYSMPQNDSLHAVKKRTKKKKIQQPKSLSQSQ